MIRNSQSPARKSAPARRMTAETKARTGPSVRRLDDDPTAIIRQFVRTLERMSGRPMSDDER